jgi:hypothetical protein
MKAVRPGGLPTAHARRGILSGMSTRPRSQAGPPMTLGNMRANGVRSLDLCCWQCQPPSCDAERRPPARSHAGTEAQYSSCGVRECNYLVSDLVTRAITNSPARMPSVFAEAILVRQV